MLYIECHCRNKGFGFIRQRVQCGMVKEICVNQYNLIDFIRTFVIECHEVNYSTNEPAASYIFIYIYIVKPALVTTSIKQ